MQESAGGFSPAKDRLHSPNIALVSGLYIDIGESSVFCPGGEVPELFRDRAVASGDPGLQDAWSSLAPTPISEAGAGWRKGRDEREALTMYPASVQPKFPSSKWEYGAVLGCRDKPTDSECGAVMSKYVCSKNPDHASYYKLHRCNEPTCPVCYPKYAKRISDAVTRRVGGLATVYPEQSPYHLIFWGKKGQEYKSLSDAHKEAAKMLKGLGVTSAVVWYHPYRIRKELKPALRRLMRKWKSEPELCRLSRKNGGFIKFGELYTDQGFWKLAHDDALGIGSLDKYVEYGAHFHAIATGYLKKSDDWSRLTGGGYKKKGYVVKQEHVERLTYYLTTHAAYERTKSTVRYLGLISYNKLASKVVEKRVEDIRCEDCGALMLECDCDPITRETGRIIQERVTCLVKERIYWKRGEPEPKHGQQSIESFEIPTELFPAGLL